MAHTEYLTTVPAVFPELDGIVYLTGVTTRATEAAQRDDLGLLVTPRNSVAKKAGHYAHVGADNGLYNERHPLKGFDFDADRWLLWVADLDRSTTLFVTLPDVLNWLPELDDDGTQKLDKNGKPAFYCVADYEATLERSAAYADIIRDLGFPVALVAQDGLEDLDDVPFAIDALFIGGSDGYKLGPAVARLVAQAKARGLWVHMGRVNSLKRIRYAEAIGCDSADGTFIGFKPSENYGRVIGWLEALASERQ